MFLLGIVAAGFFLPGLRLPGPLGDAVEVLSAWYTLNVSKRSLALAIGDLVGQPLVGPAAGLSLMGAAWRLG